MRRDQKREERSFGRRRFEEGKWECVVCREFVERKSPASEEECGTDVGEKKRRGGRNFQES